MSDLFSDNTLLPINIFYKVEKNKQGIANVTILTVDEAIKLKATDAKVDVRELRTKWKKMSWKTANELLQKASVWNNHANQMDTNWLLYRDSRLKMGLIEWEGDDVKDIPCNEESINKMHVNIAIALLDAYDKAIKGDEEESAKN